jgi:hypothetical protein
LFVVELLIVKVLFITVKLPVRIEAFPKEVELSVMFGVIFVGVELVDIIGTA